MNRDHVRKQTIFDGEGAGLGAALSLGTTPAPPKQIRLALLIVAVLFLLLLGSAPFAAVPLQRIPAFIATIAALIFVTNLVTAFLLFGQFWLIRKTALLVLASGYLFTSLIVIPHALSFPGVIAPTGLLGNLQSALWLYYIWHYGFTLFVLAYVFLKDRAIYLQEHLRRRAIAFSVVVIVAVVCGLALGLSGADVPLPNLSLDEIRHGTVVHFAAATNALLNALAAISLWRRRSSSLDVWLMVAVCAGITEPLLTGFLSSARFDFGFYASRAYSVVTSTVVLAALLSEIARLYLSVAHNAIALERERDNTLSANRRLAVQWAQLRKANAFKNEVLGALAHDLRNPLTVILGRADMLLRMLNKGATLGDRLRGHIDQIRAAADHMNKMVESLLSDARADALDITIRLDKVDLSTLVHEVVESNQPLAAKKEQSIIVSAPPACWVQCDGGRLRDVVDNLLSNAIKYSEVGGRIDLVLEQQHKNVVIRVKDQGAGLSAEDLSRVFGRFQRLSAKPTGNESSIGLGLSIVKRIVDLHDGSVNAASAGPGLGATFTVTLPRQTPIVAHTEGESSSKHYDSKMPCSYLRDRVMPSSGEQQIDGST